ncbi:MAG: hypothetical protein AB2L10_02330 [Methanospirillum sp.]
MEDNSFIPPINEIKDSFDHLMRVFGVKCGFKEKNGNYIQENLDAVFRHVYRATYDLLDYIRIYQKQIIYRKMEGFSRETIVTVFPDYYPTIIPEVEQCLTKIPILKGDKDIGDPDIEKVKEFVSITEKLHEICSLIDQKYPALIEYESKKQSEEQVKEVKQEEFQIMGHKIAYKSAIVGGIIGSGIGAIIAFVLAYLYL